ncbi:hypothetical protein AAG570_010777 [Ranatra chinensis]|uniref:Large ribosomal subunit protein mL50 n=1 Tax=Ranatra chinensis TaxID=642074 RepID=A0ABD0YNI5_9HEMI
MATGKWRIDRTTSAPLRRILLVNIDHVVPTMAALVNHVLSKSHQTFIKLSSHNAPSNTAFRFYAKKHYKQKLTKVKMPECRKLKSTEDSIASKGFLRCQKDYSPPEDLDLRLQSLYKQYVGPLSDRTTVLSDSNNRFALFTACYSELKHSIPNSILHTIKNYDDLYSFYATPVDSTLPLDKMKTIELPPNLHIQSEYLRFHPDEDTMFGGQTAFPQSNTLVTGLRTRKKYKGHIVTNSWPDQI